MKKFTLRMLMVTVLMAISTVSFAQVKNLTISTVNGTSIDKYDGQVRNVVMHRSTYNGWNTICVPFDLSENQINEAFGSSCKIEALTNVSAVNDGFVLNFTDVKAEGIKANVPYLLYYTGENKSIMINAPESTLRYSADPSVKFYVDGSTIKLTGAQTHIAADGQYGIYVKDNSDANFSVVEPTTTGFYATRCYLTVEGKSNARIYTTHNSDATSISAINAQTGKSEVYGINGVRQNAVQKGVNVVNGKKVYVK